MVIFIDLMRARVAEKTVATVVFVRSVKMQCEKKPRIKTLLDEIEKYHLYDDGYWVGIYMALKTWQELRRKYE